MAILSSSPFIILIFITIVVLLFIGAVVVLLGVGSCFTGGARGARALARAGGGRCGGRLVASVGSRRRGAALGRAAPSDSRARVLARGAMRRLGEICSALSLAQMEVLSEACDFARTVAQQAGRAKRRAAF